MPELTGFSGRRRDQGRRRRPRASVGSGAPQLHRRHQHGQPPGPPDVQLRPSPAPSRRPRRTTYTRSSGGSGSIADVFVFGKYISLLDTQVIAGGRSAVLRDPQPRGRPRPDPGERHPDDDRRTDRPTSRSTSRRPTASATACSFLTGRRAPRKSRYRRGPGSQSIDIFYQWLTGPDQKTNLVASAPPSAKHVAINWDSDTGLGPRQIQVVFVGTVNGQNPILYLPATPSNRGDYTVDAQVLAVTLLKRLQDITAAGTALPASIDFTLKVQPWLPASAEGLRVRTEPKELKSKVKVNLHYNATSQNALPAVTPADYPASAPPATPPPDAATTGQFTPAPGAAGLTPNTAQCQRPGCGSNGPATPRSAFVPDRAQQPPALAMPPLHGKRHLGGRAGGTDVDRPAASSERAVPQLAFIRPRSHQSNSLRPCHSHILSIHDRPSTQHSGEPFPCDRGRASSGEHQKAAKTQVTPSQNDEQHRKPPQRGHAKPLRRGAPPQLRAPEGESRTGTLHSLLRRAFGFRLATLGISLFRLTKPQLKRKCEALAECDRFTLDIRCPGLNVAEHGCDRHFRGSLEIGIRRVGVERCR